MAKTVTPEVIAANKQNAKKSTGPRQTSATKNNAVTHGLSSKSLMFQTEEEREEFETLTAELHADLLPRGILQKILVQEIAVCHWKLDMVQRLMLQDLRSQQKASEAIFRGVLDYLDDPLLQPPSENEHLCAVSRIPWGCNNLSVTLDGDTSAGRKLSELGNANKQDRNSGRATHIGLAARLGAISESLLRYERAWKSDLYRAMAALRTLQQDDAHAERG